MRNPMRILIIHTSYTIKGGEDSVVENEKDLLISAGHVVLLLSFSNGDREIKKLLQLPFNYSSYRNTTKTLTDFRPDVVHIHNLHFAGSVSVLYAVKKSKVPMVVTLHNYRLLCPSGTLFFKNKLFTGSVHQIFPLEAIAKGIYHDSKLLTFWLALCNASHQLLCTWAIPNRFIVLGEKEKEIFEYSKYQHLAGRMVIKPNFCPPSPSRYTPSGEYFLFVGRLSEEKGIEMMLHTFSKSGHPLIIIGSGPLENKVKEQASLYANIRFLGIYPKEKICELMAEAIALIFPSIWHETFGMVIIEAFACGTPVIASAIGEAIHLVKHERNGLLFEAGNESALLDSINSFNLLSKENKLKYSDEALKTYERHYTPTANLKQLEKIYHSLQ